MKGFFFRNFPLLGILIWGLLPPLFKIITQDHQRSPSRPTFQKINLGKLVRVVG